MIVSIFFLIKLMTTIFYTYFNSKIEDTQWKRYITKVPNDIQNRINKFKRWEDRHASLLGKLLLLKGLEKYGVNYLSLSNLSYNKFGRPSLGALIDFNISHSGEYVVCAFTDQGKVGIDIEKINNISLLDFNRFMADDEWHDIMSHDPPHEKFYDYWTIKESVMKAYGKGLSIPLKDICIKNNKAMLYNSQWFVKEVKIHFAYKCHISLNSKPLDIMIEKIDF